MITYDYDSDNDHDYEYDEYDDGHCSIVDCHVCLVFVRFVYSVYCNYTILLLFCVVV